MRTVRCMHKTSQQKPPMLAAYRANIAGAEKEQINRGDWLLADVPLVSPFTSGDCRASNRHAADPGSRCIFTTLPATLRDAFRCWKITLPSRCSTRRWWLVQITIAESSDISPAMTLAGRGDA